MLRRQLKEVFSVKNMVGHNHFRSLQSAICVKTRPLLQFTKISFFALSEAELKSIILPITIPSPLKKTKVGDI